MIIVAITFFLIGVIAHAGWQYMMRLPKGSAEVDRRGKVVRVGRWRGW